jgi:hypothetical protein
MSSLVPLSGGRSPGGDDTGGGPLLEYRVARLEEGIRDIKATLKSMDARLGAIEVAIAQLNGRMAGIEGRLQQIPTVWQTISILAVLLFGVAGVVFAAGNFLKP